MQGNRLQSKVRATAIALPQGLSPVRLYARAAMSALIAFLFLGLLHRRIQDVDLTSIPNVITSTSVPEWLLALALTAVSYWAAGHYDVALHRHLSTGVPSRCAHRAGMAAIALSQTLGLGLITGAFVRWRLLPELPLARSMVLTIGAALSFLFGWSVVTGVVLALSPLGAGFAGTEASALFAISLLCAFVLSSAQRFLQFVRPPNALTLWRLSTFATIDLLAAAGALQVFLPIFSLAEFDHVLPVFLLAYGAGLVSGVPGGVGAFEVVFISLLPPQPQAEILGAILSWRVCYFLLPTVLGAAAVLHGPTLQGVQKPSGPPPPLALASRAECGLLRQGAHQLTCVAPHRAWLVGRTGHLLTGLFAPIDHAVRPNPALLRGDLAALESMASAEARLPVLYKVDARHAARARREGWVSRRIAREAWIDPQSFVLQGPARAGLRRKLRKAQSVGVTATSSARTRIDVQAWAALDALAQDWAQRHRRERGFSMGRHDRRYLACQNLYIAWHEGHPVAYASFHTSLGEWTLDLMRHDASMPDGTMHLLIVQALQDAAQEGIARLSLASIPEGAFARPGGLHARLCASEAGLLRFKAAFAPHWQPLYLVTRRRWHGSIVAASLARAILFPHPLLHAIEQDHVEYVFAPRRAPWHRR